MCKKIYIQESALISLKEGYSGDDNEVTFFKFFTELKKFLKGILTDPLNSQPSKFFKEHNISRNTLLNKLFEKDIVSKNEDIREPEDANGKMSSMHYVQYKIKRKNFETKVRRLYSFFFESGKKSYR